MNPKLDKEIIRTLKVEYIAKPIVNTNKGLLALVTRNDDSEPYLVLDAVPLEKEKSDYLIGKIFLQKDENIQSIQKRDVEGAQEDNPTIEEEGIETGSPETSEGVEGNKEEVI